MKTVAKYDSWTISKISILFGALIFVSYFIPIQIYPKVAFSWNVWGPNNGFIISLILSIILIITNAFFLGLRNQGRNLKEWIPLSVLALILILFALTGFFGDIWKYVKPQVVYRVGILNYLLPIIAAFIFYRLRNIKSLLGLFLVTIGILLGVLVYLWPIGGNIPFVILFKDWGNLDLDGRLLGIIWLIPFIAILTLGITFASSDISVNKILNIIAFLLVFYWCSSLLIWGFISELNYIIKNEVFVGISFLMLRIAIISLFSSVTIILSLDALINKIDDLIIMQKQKAEIATTNKKEDNIANQFCKKCGSKIKPGSRFCGECGSALD